MSVHIHVHDADLKPGEHWVTSKGGGHILIGGDGEVKTPKAGKPSKESKSIVKKMDRFLVHAVGKAAGIAGVPDVYDSETDMSFEGPTREKLESLTPERLHDLHAKAGYPIKVKAALPAPPKIDKRIAPQLSKHRSPQELIHGMGKVSADTYDTYTGGNVMPDELVHALSGCISSGDNYSTLISIENDHGIKRLAVAGSSSNGAVARYFDINADGRLSVEHKMFYLADEFQSQGIAKKAIKEAVATYEKMGVDRINLEANIDVGGYAWARYGFVPKQHSWDALKEELSGRLDNLVTNKQVGGQLVSQVRDILASKDPASIRCIAALQDTVTDGGKTITLGKKLLLGTKWQGSLNMKDKESLDILKGYIK